MTKYLQYECYINAEIKWFSTIPSHWQVMQLKRTVLGCTNGIWGSEPKNDSFDTVVLRVADFDRPRLSTHNSGYTFRRIEDAEKKVRKLKYGDLLIEKSGGGERTLVGQVVLFDKKFEAVTSNFVAKMTPLEFFSSTFLNYVFSKFYSDKINFCSIKQNTGIQNLDSSSYLAEKFGFPPLDEQQKIANFLDHETAKIDTLIAKQQQLIQLLKEKRQAVISHAVTKGLNPDAPMRDSGVEWLGEVPAHWEVKRIKNYGKIIGGYAFKSTDFCLGGARVVKISNVSHLSLDWSDSSYVPRSFIDAHRDYVIPKGALIFAMTRPIINGGVKVAKFESDEEVLLNQRVGFLKKTSEIIQEYLMYVAQSKSFLCAFENNCTVTNQPNISADGIECIHLSCPDLSEQLRIVSYIKGVLASIERTVESGESQILLLQERRTALISAAVTGKIDVRNWVSPDASSTANTSNTSDSTATTNTDAVA